MKKKRRKRLVSTWKYVWVTTWRAIFGTASAFFYLLGGLTLLLAAFILWFEPMVGCVWGCIAAFLMSVGFCLSRTRRSIKPVAPITRHTVNLLPAEEILVRPSDAPPSQQEAELLRAAMHGHATPAEEMLRATSTDRQAL
jgi:hypothetical protein